MSSVRKDQGDEARRDRPEMSFPPAVRTVPRPSMGGDTVGVNGERSLTDPGARPSPPTARPNASINGIHSTHTAPVPGIPEVTTASESHSHLPAQNRPLDFKNTDLYRKLKASKLKRGSRLNPQMVPRSRPDPNGSGSNPVPAPLTTTGHVNMDVDTDSPSPASMTGFVDPDLPAISVQPMQDVESTAAVMPRTAIPSLQNAALAGQNLLARTTSVATRTIIPQNRVASPGPRIVIRGTANAVIGNPAVPSITVPPPILAQPPAQPSAQPTAVDIVRGLIATEERISSPGPAVPIIENDIPSPRARTPSRSPSFEILDQETYIYTTTPGKKRKLGKTFPPQDAPASDLSGQEVELLSGIEENAEAVSSELLASLLEDEEMTGSAGGIDSVPKQAVPPAAPRAAPVTAVNPAQTGTQLAGWTAPRDQAPKPFNSLIDAVNLAANAFQATAASAVPSSSSSIVRMKKTSGPGMNSTVASSTSVSTASVAVERPSVQAPVFKVPHPVSMTASKQTPIVRSNDSFPGISVKGKEPLRPEPARSREPFERKASPPVPQASTGDRQELWKKQAAELNGGNMPKDVDSMLHGNDDDPFLALQQAQNAVAGPSFKYPEVTDSAYIHMLPEPRAADPMMSKDFDYRKFNDPLLDCINSLPEHAQNAAHIRVILEAYYSQSSLDRAPAIRIDGGESDEYPPAEFKYSDEVYYSEKVPKPWLGKGCECVGPCSENSDCFCLKRQEMYFASYVTDPIAGPLKGFAYNDDGTLKDCQYPTWECGPQCDCPPACKNRVMQKGRSPKVQLEVYKTRKKGWGVRALSSFPKGTFVGLYSGELIPEDETDARGEIYNAIERTYLFDLDHWHIKQPPDNLASIDPAGAYIAQQAGAILQEEDEKGALADEEGQEVSMFSSFFTVDAFHWGFTRFFNHSCDPNLVLSAAYFDDFDIRKPRLAITAKRDVRKGDELCISYTGPPDDDEMPPMIETDEQLTARTGGKNEGKRTVVKKRKGGTAHKQKATQTPEKLEKGRCQCGAKNCMGYMFNAYSGN